MMQVRIGKASGDDSYREIFCFQIPSIWLGVIASNNKNINIKNNYVNINYKSIINISKPPILRDRCIYNGTSKINTQKYRISFFLHLRYT